MTSRSRHRLSLAASLLCLLMAAPAAAQAPRQITFDEALRIAFEQNVPLQQAQNRTDVQRIQVNRARMQFYPSLEIGSSAQQNYGRQFSQEESKIVNRVTESLGAEARTSVNLFNGFSDVATLRQSRLLSQASEADLRRAEQTVVFSVASDYIALIAQSAQVKVQQENLEAERQLLAQIEQFVRVGARPASDLYTQQAAVAGAELSVLEAQQQVQIQESNLIQTLQLDPFEPYVFATPEVDTSLYNPLDLAAPSLLRRAYTDRPDLRASELNIRAAEAGIRAAQSTRWPRLSLTFNYGTAWNSEIPSIAEPGSTMPFGEQLRENRGGGVGLSLGLPIFDRNLTRYNTQLAQIDYNDAQLRLDALQQDIAVQVRQAYLDYQTAQKQVEVSQTQVRAAALALQAEQERYELGAATLIQVSQARAQFVRAESALVQARYDRIFRERLLDYYAGALDPQQPLF